MTEMDYTTLATPNALTPGTYRCDKVTFLFKMEPDRFESWFIHLQEVMETAADEFKTPIHFNTRVLGADTTAGTRFYEVDTYGAASDYLLARLPLSYLQFISRLDLRLETDIAADRITPLVAYAERNQRGNRNISKYATRERAKTKGRHAGGVGMSVGSHKSDQRLAVYKKKGERGAIEIQVSGKALDSVIKQARATVAEGKGANVYDEIIAGLAARLQVLSQTIGFAGLSQLVAFVADEPTSGESEASLQQAAREVADHLQGLSQKERRALVQSLGVRLSDLQF